MAELLSITEAARKMHVSRQTIYAWIRKGKTKAVRISGGKYRIPVQQLTSRVPKRQTRNIAVKGRGRQVPGSKNQTEGHYMPEHPLKIYENLDPKLLDLVNDTQKLALTDGAMPRKTKLLIAMVLDAVHGASDGVQSLARQAIKAGASKEEIAEALRVAQYICGVGCVYTAARALREVLQ